jgi:glycosyltransferase involved in cell wall biosynthesis
MSPFPELTLSVVLPAYNEERLIEATIERAVGSLQRAVGRFEILLIDDCSTDRTPQLADALGERFPQVRVLHNARNLGQGGCLRLGFAQAQYELVTHNAVDYPFDFDDLPRVLGPFPDADVVVVTRRSYPGVSAGRRFVSWGNRTLTRWLFGLEIEDYNFVQVYRRSVLQEQQCFSTATAFITVERIVRAHHAGHRVVAIAADYHRRPSGVSSSGNWRVVRDSLRDMARLRLELRRAGAQRPGARRCQKTTP